MTTIEGGMICTDNLGVYENLRMMRSHGMVREASTQDTKDYYTKMYPGLNPDFIFAFPSYNMRNNELSGILGLNQLPNLDKNVILRNRNHERFLSQLDSNKYFTDFKLEGASNYAFNLILKEKDDAFCEKLMNTMRSEGIEFRRGLSGGGNQLRQPYFKKNYNINYDDFKNIDHIHHFGWYVGNYPTLEREKINTLIETLNNI
jgi:CDP-6-deoxy-D-xylo-4-hexulose-3-dehydrase